MSWKKIIFILPVVLMAFSATDVMAEGCVLDKTCKQRSDDHLYPRGAGGCYICDSSDCNGGTQLTVYNAELDGQLYNGWQSFVCSTGGNDLWKKVTLQDCTDTIHSRLKNSENTRRVPWNPNQRGESQNNHESYAFIGADVCMSWECLDGYKEVDGECVVPGSKATPKKVTDKTKCVDDSGNKTIIAGILREVTCEKPFNSSVTKEHATRCKAKCGAQEPGIWKVGVVECEKGYHGVDSLGDGMFDRCEKGGNGGGNGVGLTCRQKRAGAEWSNVARACCDTNADADYVKATDQCVCKDPTKEFKMNDAGRGACVAKGQPAPEAKCECNTTITTTAIAKAKSQCGGRDAAVATAITTIEKQCANNGAKCDAGIFLDNIEIINNAIAGGTCALPVNDEAALKRITEKVNSVEKRFGELDVSVWKTAEGNFNGARLASDSIAGVVLGTTGALITSNVVKKNQIKSGFEDIVCTVGGQTVGNYGDEITVGIK